MKSLNKYFRVTIVGTLMGIAEAIPGVSGGTIAFIFKIYLEDLNAVYYRVRVGPYDSFQDASNIRLKLNNY